MQFINCSTGRWTAPFAAIVACYHRFAFYVTTAFHDSRFVLHAVGKTRRFMLVHFRKRYVRDQLAARQGHCRQCGTCCNLLFICPMLTRQGRCMVYGLCRPQACKVFPIDQRDIDEVRTCGGHCGYRFDHDREVEPCPFPGGQGQGSKPARHPSHYNPV